MVRKALGIGVLFCTPSAIPAPIFYPPPGPSKASAQEFSKESSSSNSILNSMNIKFGSRVKLALVTLFLALPLSAEPASVQIEGDVRAPLSITLESARSTWPDQLMNIEFKVKDRVETGIALSITTALEAAKVDVGEHKSEPLRFAVLAVGADRYFAVFSLAELLTDFGDRKVYLMWTEDGEKLRLIVPGEKRAGRSVYQLEKLEVQRLKPKKELE